MCLCSRHADQLAVAATTIVWKETVTEGKEDTPRKTADLYASDAVLWGTVSEEVRETPEQIYDYFVSTAVSYSIEIYRSPPGCQMNLMAWAGWQCCSFHMHVTARAFPASSSHTRVSSRFLGSLASVSSESPPSEFVAGQPFQEVSCWRHPRTRLLLTGKSTKPLLPKHISRFQKGRETFPGVFTFIPTVLILMPSLIPFLSKSLRPLP